MALLEMDQLVSYHGLTKVNVNINTTNKRGKQGRNFYRLAYELAMVQAKRIPINNI